MLFFKGKENKKYEFGHKVSIMQTLNTSVIVGAIYFRNEFDGYVLHIAVERGNHLTEKVPLTARVD